MFFSRNRDCLYQSFSIPKKSGGSRTIEAPVPRLKYIQAWINDKILGSFSPSVYATGFRKGFSIVNNAEKHIGKELVINLDLKDFFPSIRYRDVLPIFVYFGYKLDVAHLLTKLCTNGKNVLPQGSPASPAISNLVLLRMDKRLGKLADSLHGAYTRYADDITLSGAKSLRSVVPLVYEIISEEGYTVNPRKTRFQYSNQRQEVTGIIVNKKLSVSPKIEKELKNAIYFCGKYGVTSHMEHIQCDKSFYKEHLYGLAYFIKMIDEPKGTTYLKKLDAIIW